MAQVCRGEPSGSSAAWQGACTLDRVPRVPSRLAVAAALLAASLAACDFIDHESGREFGVGLVTPMDLSETRAESVRWLETRGGYTIVESRDRLLRAEKGRGAPVAEVDELTVTLDSERDGTRVNVNARTFIIAGGSRFQADEVSGPARGDAGALAQHLTMLTAPR
jgi:hypothetical protein